MHYKIWVSLNKLYLSTSLLLHLVCFALSFGGLILTSQKKAKLSRKHYHCTKTVPEYPRVPEWARLFLFRLEIAKSFNPLNGTGAESHSHRAGGGMCAKRWGDRDKELPHTLVSVSSKKLKKATAAEEGAPFALDLLQFHSNSFCSSNKNRETTHLAK